MKRLLNFLGRHAWIFVVLAFVGFMGILTAIIILERRHPVEEIPVSTPYSK